MIKLEKNTRGIGKQSAEEGILWKGRREVKTTFTHLTFGLGPSVAMVPNPGSLAWFNHHTMSSRSYAWSLYVSQWAPASRSKTCLFAQPLTNTIDKYIVLRDSWEWVWINQSKFLTITGKITRKTWPVSQPIIQIPLRKKPLMVVGQRDVSKKPGSAAY